MEEFKKLFAHSDDARCESRYEASCHCGTIRYEVCSDPVDAKICHCIVCRKLHGVSSDTKK